VGRREIENIRKHHVEQQVAPKGVGTIYSTPSFRKKVNQRCGRKHALANLMEPVQLHCAVSCSWKA
jgi:hypothetical protein